MAWIVFGPILRNIFYDGLLILQLPAGACLVSFADYAWLVVVNHTTEGIEAAVNGTLSVIYEHRLKLAHLK